MMQARNPEADRKTAGLLQVPVFVPNEIVHNDNLIVNVHCQLIAVDE
jgi:hypothetical protein